MEKMEPLKKCGLEKKHAIKSNKLEKRKEVKNRRRIILALGHEKHVRFRF
jgi:hypothetical protein